MTLQESGAARSMSKIQDFAREEFGITLTQDQIELIEAWAEGKVLINYRAAGRTTAKMVMLEYIKDGLESES